ncbi:MAG: hypothetical protein HZA95_02060 [Candidatus Vogelbacteria bacterium]|nr:hypothetical protein [Candidatus Vogelbacteria bacterium]
MRWGKSWCGWICTLEISGARRLYSNRYYTRISWQRN